MKIVICRDGENIISLKDYSDVNDKGEIAHMLVEVELIKQDLLELWERYSDPENLESE